MHNPAATFLRNAVPRPRPGGTPSEALTLLPPVRYQFLLATGIVLLAVAATVAARERTGLDLAVLAYTVVFWVAPLVAGGHLAQYRAQLMLLPSVLLLRRLPAAVLAVLAVAAAAVAWKMAGLFYHHTLI